MSSCKLTGLINLNAVVLFTGLFVFSGISTAAVTFPQCNIIHQWASASYESDRNVRGGFYQGKYLASGFRDDLHKQAFGTTFDQWSDANVKQFKDLAVKCGTEAVQLAKAASKQRNYDATKIYNNSQQFLLSIIGAYKPEGRVDSYEPLMAHQRKVYAELKKAQALKADHLATAESLPPSKASIQKLADLAADPQLEYLHPVAKKNHEITLHNRGVELADQMVDNAAARFNEFPETLAGLEELQAYRQQLQTDLKGVQSTKWNAFESSYMARTISIAGKATDQAIAGLGDFSTGLDGLKKLMAYRLEMQQSLGQTRSARYSEFEKAYAEQLNILAATAVDDFAAELNALPPTAMSLGQVRTSVNSLFQYRPTPANLQAYQEVAQNRARNMEQEIRKVECYKTLDGAEMEADARELPLLSHDGETTLGLFVCDITRRGNKFQSFEGAGWFGSASTLNILNSRGITLSIEMEEVEAVKGKPMLVGVMVKDVSSETKLTLTGWQDYALKLVRGY